MSTPAPAPAPAGVLSMPDLAITETNWEAGLRSLLARVRPQWQFDRVHQRLFTEGITNKLVAMHVGSDARPQFGEDVVLVRVYGEKTELIIDRQAEVRNMLLLHANGFCQPLYATFSNGLCYGYIHGDVADEDMVRDPTVARLIARELAALHCLQPDPQQQQQQKPTLFDTMRRWLELGPDSFDEAERQARLRGSAIPDKAGLLAEIADIEARLTSLPDCPAVFSHNDTLIKNLVYNKPDRRVYLIDYEYCSVNYLPFDIANHFNEFAGVATVDHARYPSRDFQLPWLRHYLACRDQLLAGRRAEAIVGEYGDVVDNEPGSDLTARAEQLYSQVGKFSLASHLFWSLWALVQARYSTLDFDFLDYAISRYGEYAAKKVERLAL